MTNRTWIICAALIIGWPFAAAMALPDPLPGCHVEPHAANAGGTRINCQGSEWLGSVDNQGGKYVPGDPKKLNSNFSAGNRQNPGYVVLVADVGKGVLVDDGESKPKKLMVLRHRKYGPSGFRIRMRFEKGLIACDRRGCVNVVKALRRR